MHLITAESVTEGHPDKLCDHISDSILDALLAQDPDAHAAVETTACGDLIHVFGEIRSTATVDVERIVRNVIRHTGYTAENGLDPDTARVMVDLSEQSPEIAQGVDGANQGAGDQGSVFGYAVDETESLMPMPLLTAHRLAIQLAGVRRTGVMPELRPDGKTQVTFEYENGRPTRVDTVLVSAQHEPDVSMEWLRERLEMNVVQPVLNRLPVSIRTDGYRLLVNPTGSFIKGGPAADSGLTGRKIIVDTYGGPAADSGLTGRKIIVDTYGGAARHGGGAFSGKDPSKTDRSAAYAARWVAKNIVAAGLASRAEVQIAYAIGVAEPVSVNVNTYGTANVGEERIIQAVGRVFDLRPAMIVERLDLKRPIYAKTATYGHFGRNDPDFTWERTDMAGALRHAVGLD